MFNISHKKISIRGSHTCAHGSAMDLKVMFVTNHKVISFQDVRYEAD